MLWQIYEGMKNHDNMIIFEYFIENKKKLHPNFHFKPTKIVPKRNSGACSNSNSSLFNIIFLGRSAKIKSGAIWDIGMVSLGWCGFTRRSPEKYMKY